MLQKRWSRSIRRERRAKRKNLLPAIMLFCMVLLLLQPQLFGVEIDFYNRILALQFPFFYSASPLFEQTPPPEEIKADIDEDVGDFFRIELAEVRRAENVVLAQDAPSVLIYHTHTTEAYRQNPLAPYEESGEWRTHDAQKSVVAVGDKLAGLLRDEYGLNVIHDTTDHEPPKLSTSYSRSVLTMEAYKERYPSITMFIDVHRDAYGKEEGKKDFIVVDGKENARLMFVVGTGEGATGSGFKEMPDFKANYALAAAISTRLRQIHPELARDVRVKAGRYNQHISSQCLLVEVGHNMNTLEQAMNAVDHLARAIGGIVTQQKTGSGGTLMAFPE